MPAFEQSKLYERKQKMGPKMRLISSDGGNHLRQKGCKERSSGFVLVKERE